MTPPLIDTPAALHRVCDEFSEALRHDPRLAVDTEFVGEQSYDPRIMLIQLALPESASSARSSVALIDAMRLGGKLDPLAGLMNTPGLLKIVHAGGQDVPILNANLGPVSGPWFDTQIAAAFLGYPLQVGYARLVESMLGVRLGRDETRSDWARRPIPQGMLDYAADDVRYLPAVHARLASELVRQGRAGWCAESVDEMLRNACEPVPQGELWRKVARNTGLDAKTAVVLRGLCIWRDEEARRSDKPRRTILKDEPLVELARRAPKTAEAVLNLRNLPAHFGQRRAAEIAEVVKSSLALPRDQWPQVEPPPPILDDQAGALYELLSAVVRVRAAEAGIAPTLLASADPLRRLAASRSADDVARLVSGWRGALIGDDLRAALEGRLSVAWNPQAGRLECRLRSLT